jgi:hypothetical protein
MRGPDSRLFHLGELVKPCRSGTTGLGEFVGSSPRKSRSPLPGFQLVALKKIFTVFSHSRPSPLEFPLPISVRACRIAKMLETIAAK